MIFIIAFNNICTTKVTVVIMIGRLHPLLVHYIWIKFVRLFLFCFVFTLKLWDSIQILCMNIVHRIFFTVSNHHRMFSKAHNKNFLWHLHRNDLNFFLSPGTVVKKQQKNKQSDVSIVIQWQLFAIYADKDNIVICNADDHFNTFYEISQKLNFM